MPEPRTHAPHTLHDPRRPRPRARRQAAAALGLAALFVLPVAACGSDGEQAAGPDEAAAPTSTTAPSDFCDAGLRVEQVLAEASRDLDAAPTSTEGAAPHDDDDHGTAGASSTTTTGATTPGGTDAEGATTDTAVPSGGGGATGSVTDGAGASGGSSSAPSSAGPSGGSGTEGGGTEGGGTEGGGTEGGGTTTSMPPLGEVPEALESAMDELEAAAPDELREDVDRRNQEVRSAFEARDAAILQSGGYRTLDDRIDHAVADGCADDRVEVRAVDYRFEDVPRQVAAGRVAFVLRNEGAELHEMALFRIHDDVTDPIEDLLDRGESAQASVDEVGFGFAAPEGADEETFELTEGRYALVCFIPVGLTPDAMDAGEEPDGPPHFTRGMATELRVQGAGGGTEATTP